MSEPPLVVVDAVTKLYGTEVTTRALCDVRFELARGEFAALTGPSGSGKSTLLNLLGLLDRPSTGRILLSGIDTTSADERERTELRARFLGFVFQFHHLLPAFTAVENVMLPTWGQVGYPSEELRARSEALLREVGLGHRLGYRATQLSGGEQQRVAITRALVHDPPLLLADEPTGNLDSETSGEVFALFRRFNRERGTACLIVTHDERIAGQCDRVIQVVDGRIRSDERRA